MAIDTFFFLQTKDTKIIRIKCTTKMTKYTLKYAENIILNFQQNKDYIMHDTLKKYSVLGIK